MTRLLIAITVIIALLASAACGGSDDEGERAAFTEEGFPPISAASADSFDKYMQSSAPAAPGVEKAQGAPGIPGAMMESSVAKGSGIAPSSGTSLQLADRKIISTGSITVEVEDVQASGKAVESIADSLGGYVERLSSSGGDEYSWASLTIRVPQGQFASAYDRIRNLGEVLNEDQGSEDVSEQFIDLEARLKSALREEQSFLALLGRSSNVSEVLAIERELARVRADIERYQGQLDFLTRRVALSTIYVELAPETGPFVEPPFASLRLTVDDVPGSLDTVRNIIASHEGEIYGGAIYDEDGEQRADLDAFVFYANFRNVLNELERVGDVAAKSIREPVLDPDGGMERDPEAQVYVQLEEPDYSWRYVVGIVVVLGVLLLIIIVVGARSFVSRRRRAAPAGA